MCGKPIKLHVSKKMTIKDLGSQVLFIALVAILCMGVLNTLYASITQGGPINWGITGRWVIMIFHGTFSTASVGLLPVQPHEWLIGFLAHDIIALMFSLAYILCCQYILKKPPHCLNGIGFGWLLMVFPFFIQMPSTGEGILAIHALDRVSALLQTFRCHTFFGLGLGLGGISYHYLKTVT